MNSLCINVASFQFHCSFPHFRSSFALQSLPLCNQVFRTFPSIVEQSDLNGSVSIATPYFLFALALGPQFASGFSGNRVNFINLDGGFASCRMSKQAWILENKNSRHISIFSLNPSPLHTHIPSGAHVLENILMQQPLRPVHPPPFPYTHTPLQDLTSWRTP